VYPVLDRPPVPLPATPGRLEGLWPTLFDLADAPGIAWTLGGGQMVLLHGLEHGITPPRVSTDLDIIANARIVGAGVSAVVTHLTAMGFEFDGSSPEGIGHRYVKQGVGVDVLAPEGLGTRGSLTTTPPARTIEVEGGTQALHRTELLPVRHGGRSALAPRPSLLGAIILKTRATEVRNEPADTSDLAFLFTLIGDPLAMRDALNRSDRRHLRRIAALGDPSHPAWAGITDPTRGSAALRILTATH